MESKLDLGDISDSSLYCSFKLLTSDKKAAPQYHIVPYTIQLIFRYNFEIEHEGSSGPFCEVTGNLRKKDNIYVFSAV